MEDERMECDLNVVINILAFYFIFFNENMVENRMEMLG